MIILGTKSYDKCHIGSNQIANLYIQFRRSADPPVQKVMKRSHKAYDFNYYNFFNYYNYR